MKKTKLMHTLLALALFYGTFSSQAMAKMSWLDRKFYKIIGLGGLIDR